MDTPIRQKKLDTFVREYTAIRAAEGHGFSTANELMRLPHVDPGHPHADIWRIRQRSYDALVREALPQFGTALRILDLGAGVGWLSYRLTVLGHSTIAIDVTLDQRDGLGAARHYGCKCILADYDYLPLPDGCADLAIFNGSFHYSTNYLRTIREAMRVASAVAILDTPIYRDPMSGHLMVKERQDEFERRYGTRSNAVPSVQFLTWDDIKWLGLELNLHWLMIRPWYGLRWALKPLYARLRRTREPAQFAVLVGTPRGETRTVKHGNSR